MLKNVEEFSIKNFIRNKECSIFCSILSTEKVVKTVILHETLCQNNVPFSPRFSQSIFNGRGLGQK